MGIPAQEQGLREPSGPDRQGRDATDGEGALDASAVLDCLNQDPIVEADRVADGLVTGAALGAVFWVLLFVLYLFIF